MAGTWILKVNDQGNPDMTGNFLGWSMAFWGESIDPSKATPYQLPDAIKPLPSQSDPASTTIPSTSKTKVLTKPTNHLPSDHATAEGENHKPSFPQHDDAANPSPSMTPSPDEGYFAHITDLLKSSTWLFAVLAVVVIFASGIVFFFWRRSSRRRKGGSYAAVPGDSLGMSALERGNSRGGARSKELYDAFGEVSDDEVDEGAALVGNQQEGFRSGFLHDDEEDGQKPYRDVPENAVPKQNSGHRSPQNHGGSEGESSVSGSWIETESVQ